jgi:hypothetical protein
MKTGKNSKIFTIIASVFILVVSVLIKIATFYPSWIEKNYSRGIYPYISWFYRTLFGWIPFSLGDILYTAAFVFLLTRFVKFVNILTSRRFGNINYKRKLRNAFFVIAAIYIYFNISWGLNYNRPGIAAQLQLSPQMNNEGDLKMITGILLKKVNESRLLLGKGPITYKPYEKVFEQAQAAYQVASTGFPFLQYNTISVKRSLFGRMGNFLGFLGYYNPFTGEAQLNLTQPRFLIPYVSCHEMAHQLGYASESEANFVGYLAALRSNDTLFHYSTYFDLFNYANHELFQTDSVTAKNYYEQLDPLVKKDSRELHEYWRKSDNVVEPIIKIFYDRYLKANQQARGAKSYNEVVGWLIAYYKKYGQI